MNTAAEKFAEKFSSPVFEFIADGSFGVSTWSIPSPTDLKTVMKNAAGWYGGQWEFNGAKCILHERRGEDRGTAILYGQNLIDLSEDADNSNVYTHIMPYFVRDDDTIMGSIDNCVPTGADTNGYFKVMPLDLTREFDEEPTQAELNEKAQEYIAESSVGNIVINRNVSFINRGQTVEYRLIGDLDRIDLGDTVTVKVPPLGIEVSAVCKKTVYESYLGRYESVEIGDLKKDIVKTIAELSGQDRKYPSLFVKDTEPTKEDKIKNGDYWIKVNDMVNRIAQSLGKYRGGKWQLLCDMPEGGDYMPHVFVQPEEPIKDLTTFISVGDYWIETDSDENAKALYKYVQGPADADNGLWDKLCSINHTVIERGRERTDVTFELPALVMPDLYSLMTKNVADFTVESGSGKYKQYPSFEWGYAHDSSIYLIQNLTVANKQFSYRKMAMDTYLHGGDWYTEKYTSIGECDGFIISLRLSHTGDYTVSGEYTGSHPRQYIISNEDMYTYLPLWYFHARDEGLEGFLRENFPYGGILCQVYFYRIGTYTSENTGVTTTEHLYAGTQFDGILIPFGSENEYIAARCMYSYMPEDVRAELRQLKR